MCRYDVRAWLVWMLVAAGLATVSRNPIYLLTVLCVSRIVAERCAQPTNALTFSFWRFAVLVLLFSALFNVLFVHLGDSELFRLPAAWPLVGGAITLEALMAGLINGLAILALLSVFITINSCVPIREMVRLTPRAFNSLGVVLLIALTYVPETTRHLARIREAQAIRGHRLAGIRDWQPILIPLLIGGLERAMTLAEVMVARGYGSPTTREHGLARQGGLIAGLILALTGWGMALWIGWPGWLLLALSFLLLATLIRRAGREVKYTTYRPRAWGVDDTLFVAASLCPLVVFAAQYLWMGSGDLGYQTYPQLTWPPFQPAIGLSLLLLLFPIVGNRLVTR